MPGQDKGKYADAGEYEPPQQRQVVGRVFAMQRADRHPWELFV
jgi:hypothetical protein